MDNSGPKPYDIIAQWMRENIHLIKESQSIVDWIKHAPDDVLDALCRHSSNDTAKHAAEIIADRVLLIESNKK